MSFKEKFVKSIAISVATVSLAVSLGSMGCAKNENPASISVGDSLSILKGIEFDYENTFFDDFTNGVSYNDWFIGKQAWGEDNGGVIPENVGYTDDGVLVLSGNGDYYTSDAIKGVGTRDNGTLTGAAITSKFVTGPGRYEIKMKVLPREGACSAFWTYAYDHDTNGNHEIDIELPGGKSNSIITFENVLNTNYVKETESNSQDVKLSEVFGREIVLNDGEWHTFGFDWYTCEDGEDPEMLGEDTSMGKVVYYIDGIVTAVSDVFVPYYQARLWIGVWFPNNSGFVGNANFASDCMYVDWVKHIPFKNQPCVEFNPAMGVSQVALESEYPTTPIATENVNKVANGDFEYVRRNMFNSGWQTTNRVLTASEQSTLRQQFREEIVSLNPEYSEDEIKKAVNQMMKDFNAKPATDYCSVAVDLGYEGSCGALIKDRGMFLQKIDSVYKDFVFNVSMAVKGEGKLTIRYLGNGDTGFDTQTFEFTTDTWDILEQRLTAPNGTKAITIEITTAMGKTVYVDNVSLKIV